MVQTRTPAADAYRRDRASVETGGRVAHARDLLRTARPNQWVKNLLVAGAPFAAVRIGDEAVLWRVAVAFVAFCLASSGTYFVNDAADADADRLHPDKCRRPVAAGRVGVVEARVVGGLLFLVAAGLGLVLGTQFLVVLGLYIALTVAYSAVLKHLVVIDVMAVAGGFLLRAVAGGVAAGVSLSVWFLVVTSFGALFVVLGKRAAEARAVGTGSVAQRATLEHYQPEFLQQLLTVSMSGCLVAYCLWAVQRQGTALGIPWIVLSILPFTAALLRYALLVHQGNGEDPEALAAHDRGLQGAALVWIAACAIGLFVH